MHTGPTYPTTPLFFLGRHLHTLSHFPLLFFTPTPSFTFPPPPLHLYLHLYTWTTLLNHAAAWPWTLLLFPFIYSLTCILSLFIFIFLFLFLLTSIYAPHTLLLHPPILATFLHIPMPLPTGYTTFTLWHTPLCELCWALQSLFILPPHIFHGVAVPHCLTSTIRLCPNWSKTGFLK